MAIEQHRNLTDSSAASEHSPGSIPAPDFVAKNREVQRLLGRCLLRSQHAERLLRSIVAHHHAFGSGEDTKSLLERRAAEVAKLGMGELVDLVLEDLVRVTSRPGGHPAVPAKKKPKNRPGKVAALARQQLLAAQAAHTKGKPWFTSTVTIETSPEGAAAFGKSLRELVELRNRVIHHFGDEHDIRTTEGCMNAATYLVEADTQLVRHVDTIASWAKEVFEIRQASASSILASLAAQDKKI